MLIATSNKANRLLLLTYVGHIQLEEVARLRGDIKTLMDELTPHVRVLADFTHYESMDVEGVMEMGRMMEMVGQIGTALVVRVIPDPHREPGLNILTVFHYKQRSQVITCRNFAEAAKVLTL